MRVSCNVFKLQLIVNFVETSVKRQSRWLIRAVPGATH